jgi:radical SAM protein with 4Fe4S-binding SPASM domain
MRMYEYPKEGDLKEIKIELTKKCLLNCLHCSSKAHPENETYLLREVVISLIEQAAKLKVESIVFSGGEPLLWPWLEDAISACYLNSIVCSLYTTGINLTGDGAQRILDLRKRGLRRVIFSLYSPLKEYHEEITRQTGSFDKTVNVIRTIGSAIDRELHFVPLKRNVNLLPKLVKFAKDLGVQKISILRFVPQGRGEALKESHEMLMQKETLDLRNLIISCREDEGFDIRLGSPYNILLLNTKVDCIAAWQTLCIGPNGNIYPCDAFKNIEPRDIGLKDSYNNILSNSLKDCWERSSYLGAIRHYLTTPFGKPCSTCDSLGRCKSGCLAQKVLNQESIEDGNIGKRPDPLCLRNLIGG